MRGWPQCDLFSLGGHLAKHRYPAGLLSMPGGGGPGGLRGLGMLSTASPLVGSDPSPLCSQISQVLGNEIKFAVREPLGLR